MKLKNSILIVTTLTCAFSLVACNRAPTPVDAEPPMSAEAVATAPEAIEPATQLAPVSIFYAQVGDALKDGLIAESLPEVSATGEIFAMGVFKGATDSDSTVGLVVTSASGGEPVFQSEQSFRPAGEVPVVFEVKPVSRTWPTGDYKLVFSLNGAPCWELQLKVK